MLILLFDYLGWPRTKTCGQDFAVEPYAQPWCKDKPEPRNSHPLARLAPLALTLALTLTLTLAHPPREVRVFKAAWCG
jgi:hypothetical protein